MGSEIVIVPLLFIVIFGIVYLFVSSRHKERMALIEKGIDAAIFYSKPTKKSNLLLIFILNLSLLLISIGVAIFLGAMLHQYFQVHESVAYTGSIFSLSGIALFCGYGLTKKMKEDPA